MKSFFVGSLGAILVLFASAIIAPMYSDYRERAISARILISIVPLKQEIEQHLLESTPVEERLILSVNENIQYLRQKSDGTIIVKAKNNGQVMIFIPHRDEEQITWQCIGGPNKGVPSECHST